MSERLILVRRIWRATHADYRYVSRRPDGKLQHNVTLPERSGHAHRVTALESLSVPELQRLAEHYAPTPSRGSAGRDRGANRRSRDSHHNPVPSAMRVIRLYHEQGRTWEASARLFMRNHPAMALEVMDRVGSWPATDPELRALQKAW
jgi:hypothetical protein